MSHDIERVASSSTRPGVLVEDQTGSDNSRTRDSTTLGGDNNLIWWDGAGDLKNPYNWPKRRKFINCFLISVMALLTPLGSSILAPGVPKLMLELGSGSPELAAFVVSVYILGFAVGPLLFAPLSEIYGRNVVYHACNVCFVALMVGSARASTLSSLIVIRFISGVFGSCPMTNAGGSVADMFVQERRGRVMAAIGVGPLLGPIIGPVIGGFLAEAKGWRWLFWLMATVAGLFALLMLLFLEETYAPALLQRKVVRLRKETGNDLLRSKLDTGLSPADCFSRGISRPLKLLTRSPLCIVLSLYVAMTYSYLYLMFTSIPEVFEQKYNFGTSTVGLVYLALGIGSLIGIFFFYVTSDQGLKAMAEKEGQGMKPEYRLRPVPIATILLPIGFFIYGWTASYHLHWAIPLLGHVLIGISNILVFVCVNMALIDAFTIYAASALAANAVVRSVAGGILPICGLRMYDKLGLGWGNSLLGFVAVGMVPLSFLLIRYGERLRTRYPMANL